MRPVRLVLENFGPYRERAEIDFAALGEFFLICGKTGSGKSTLFDAITYALFGQAPGGRKGSESELVSDFSAPGDKPFVEFEFSLSGTRYKVSRTAPFSRPKRGGGFTDVPPTAVLRAATGQAAADPVAAPSADSTVASSADPTAAPAAAVLGDPVAAAAGGWRVVSDGVRDTNERIPALIGLTADEFSKIILLPQGDFQKFLEMESTERSQVLEKLFPVGLHERMAEIAKARTQEAKAGLLSLEGEIGRLLAELGEEPKARLESLKGELAEALAAESGARGEAAARELAFERERERAARAVRAREAADALAALEGRAPAEEARKARIDVARAAASVAPFSTAFSKSQAAALDLSRRAALLAAERSALEAQGPDIEIKRQRIKESVSLIAAGQKELFGLQKALEVWKRRSSALERRAKAEARSSELDGRYESEAESLEALRRELEAVRPKPEDEARLRADLEKLQATGSGLALLAEQTKRWLGLFSDFARAEASWKEYEALRGARLEESGRAAAAVDELEKQYTRSEAVRLAGGLRRGEPCPVCGSLDHPAPAHAPEGIPAVSPAEIDAARARYLKVSGEAASLAASLRHAGERRDEAGAALRSLGNLVGETVAGLGEAFVEALVQAGFFVANALPADIPGFLAGFDVAAATAFAEEIARLARENGAAMARGRAMAAGFELRRKEALAKEGFITAKSASLERLRAQAEEARSDLVAARTVLAEAERESGADDPEPRHAMAKKSLEELEARKASLEAECARWDRDMAAAKASSVALAKERDGAFATLAAEFARLAESLSVAGFMPPTPGALWAEPAPAPSVESLLGQERGGLAAALARVESAALSPAALAAEESASVEYRDARVAARAKAASLEADLPAPGSAPPDLASLEASLGEARSILAAARSRSDALRLSIAGLEAALVRFSDLEGRRKALEEGSRSLYRLSELLLGKIPGRQLPFKNFVLAMYFREVTRRASAHLSRMSDGRYYLKPDDGGGRDTAGQAGRSPGRGKIGLGLRVLDSWTGLDRPTATLSGGEKFLTSISLALGLADSIREQNGGVALDAVFIDEGFGSLDDEALDRAITVLDRIRGSRVIGIVSHVAGLKARIPARIEVEKTASGSRLSQSAMFSDQAL